MEARLRQALARAEEVSRELSDPATARDSKRLTTLGREHARLVPIIRTAERLRRLEDELSQAREMAQEADPELVALARVDLDRLPGEVEATRAELHDLLVPRDPLDDRDAIVEIRAGTGGDEAAIFAGDLFRMYSRYAESQKWQLEVLNRSEGEHGGYKEIIARIIGNGAYSQLKFESGAHRVQRVPETESQGRVHTSAATVAIIPESEEVQMIEINPADLRVDTFRASGAGGQHVNKTDSAIRLTHLPTGTVVECQDERSQHKNRARAMSLLQARIYDAEKQKQRAEQAAERKSLVGGGDRSERIRTYNFPQGRMTDHRINLTLYKLDEIMQGNLGQVLDPLMHEYQAEQLASLSDDQGIG